MSAIDLIHRDLARARTACGRTAALAVSIAAFGVGLGLLWRRDMLGLGTTGAVLAIGLSIVALAVLVVTRDERRPLVLSAVAAVFVLATTRVVGGGLDIPYATDGVFWHETLTCLAKGFVTASGAALVVVVFLAWVLPIPSRRGVAVASAVPGAGALVMLIVHCPSAHLGHVAAGHWLAAFLAWPLSFLLVRRVLRRHLADVLARPGIARGGLAALLDDDEARDA